VIFCDVMLCSLVDMALGPKNELDEVKRLLQFRVTSNGWALGLKLQVILGVE
jgi:hypothetical protein